MSARIGAYELEDLENVEDIENLSPRRAPSTRDQGVGISVVGGGIMAEVDADGDGVIDKEEIQKFVSQHHMVKAEKELMKKGLIAMFVIMLLFTGVIGVLTYLTVELTKESRVGDDGVMRSSTSNDAVQCASTDLVVDSSGALVPRATAEGGRRLAQEYSNADAANALGVRNVYKKRALASTMPDAYFKELVWFELESDTGAMVSLKLLGVSRIPHSAAKCGTLLKLTTISGTLILDDTSLYYDDGLQQLFAESGFEAFSSSQSGEGARRHLQAESTTPMRRLEEGSFSIIGFFNLIDDMEWECTTVEKPEMPSEFYANITVMRPCISQLTGNNNCEITLDGGYTAEILSLVTFEGSDYHRTNQENYVSNGEQYTLEHSVLYDGVTRVKGTDADGVYRRYQVEKSGNVSHCYTDTSTTLKLNIPDDFIFYPLPSQIDNLRRFRISYVMSYDESEDTWFHTDYFDDPETHEPRVMIGPDGTILVIDNFLTGDDIPLFSDSGYTVSPDEMSKCLVVSEAFNNNVFQEPSWEALNSNVTLVKKNAERLLKAWDWSLPYPPLMRSVRAFGTNEFNYYLSMSLSNHSFADVEEFEYVQTTSSMNPDWLGWALEVQTDFMTTRVERRNRRLRNQKIVGFDDSQQVTMNEQMYEVLSTFEEDELRELMMTTEIVDGRFQNNTVNALVHRRLKKKLKFELEVDISFYPLEVDISVSVGRYSFSFAAAYPPLNLAVSAEACAFGVLCMAGSICYDCEGGGENGGDIGVGLSIREPLLAAAKFILPGFLHGIARDIINAIVPEEFDIGSIWYHKVGIADKVGAQLNVPFLGPMLVGFVKGEYITKRGHESVRQCVYSHSDHVCTGAWFWRSCKWEARYRCWTANEFIEESRIIASIGADLHLNFFFFSVDETIYEQEFANHLFD